MALLSRVGKCVLPFKVNDVIFISLCGTICVSFLSFIFYVFCSFLSLIVMLIPDASCLPIQNSRLLVKDSLFRIEDKE